MPRDDAAYHKNFAFRSIRRLQYVAVGPCVLPFRTFSKTFGLP